LHSEAAPVGLLRLPHEAVALNKRFDGDGTVIYEQAVRALGGLL
jgi:hypothetical protein